MKNRPSVPEFSQIVTLMLSLMLFLMMLFSAAIVTAETSTEEPAIVLKPNYGNIAFDTGTDATKWWNSGEEMQAAFALLVSLDLEELVPNFRITMSETTPSIIFGAGIPALMEDMNGLFIAYLVEEKNQKYFLVMVDLDAREYTITSHPFEKSMLDKSYIDMLFFAFCREQVSELGVEPINTGATFLAEQFANNK